MKINKSLQFLGRLLTSAVILGITAFFTPGFDLNNIWIIILCVVILTVIDFFIGCYTRLYYHPYLKLLIGFVLSVIALCAVQYIIIGYILSLVPIVLGAVVYGLVDYMLPNEENSN